LLTLKKLAFNQSPLSLTASENQNTGKNQAKYRAGKIRKRGAGHPPWMAWIL
jgi:hypothetical protein